MSVERGKPQGSRVVIAQDSFHQVATLKKSFTGASSLRPQGGNQGTSSVAKPQAPVSSTPKK